MSSANLGAKIKELRERRGWTQDQLADKLGMKPANVSSYERNKSIPPSNVIIALSDIFTVTTDYLLGRSDDPTNQIRLDVSQVDIDQELTALNNKLIEINKERERERRNQRDLKKFIEQSDIMFDGVPMSEEDKQRVLGFMEGMFWKAKEMNRRKPKE